MAKINAMITRRALQATLTIQRFYRSRIDPILMVFVRGEHPLTIDRGNARYTYDADALWKYLWGHTGDLCCPCTKVAFTQAELRRLCMKAQRSLLSCERQCKHDALIRNMVSCLCAKVNARKETPQNHTSMLMLLDMYTESLELQETDHGLFDMLPPDQQNESPYILQMIRHTVFFLQDQTLAAVVHDQWDAFETCIRHLGILLCKTVEVLVETALQVGIPFLLNEREGNEDLQDFLRNGQSWGLHAVTCLQKRVERIGRDAMLHGALHALEALHDCLKHKWLENLDMVRYVSAKVTQASLTGVECVFAYRVL